jgi:hypothetical protein
MAPIPTAHYANDRPPVIRVAPGQANAGGVSLTRAVPAWILSGVMHSILISVGVLLGLLNFSSAEVPPPPVTEVQTVVEENSTAVQDLTNPDLGTNPEVPLNFNVDRLADVSVPGQVDPAEAIGVPGAPPENPPMNIPAPGGLGGGFGGGVESPDKEGRGVAGLAAGGFGGIAAIPGGFGGRSGSTREKMVTEGGGNAASEAAVAAALLWLAKHQAPGGNWSLDQYNLHYREKVDSVRRIRTPPSGPGIRNDIAATAFGLLPFLAAGETHKPPAPGAKPKTYNYQKVVEGGLKYLMAKQNQQGDFGGGMYAHGLAAIAMCEAFGLTSDPFLKNSAQRAINFIVSAQDPAGGGWRYQPRQGGDTSVVGWQVMALKSGQMAGLSVPSATLKGAEKWLDSVATSDKGGYGYTNAQETPTMTSVGLLCRQYLGWSPRNPGLLAGVKRLKGVPPGEKHIYYYYYATQVMHHMGGDSWEFWNPKMRDYLIRTQEKDNAKPYLMGSWDPKGDPHGGQGGRIMQTSLSALTLEVYYRHLPLYRRDLGVNKEMKGE